MIGNKMFGHIIRNRRRHLDMTQEEVARRIGSSVPYIGHLESNKRHPSEKVVIKLAQVLGLEPRELFFLANPATKLLVSERANASDRSSWAAFAGDEGIRKIYKITEQEMEVLSLVPLMGEVRSSRDFIFILNTIRQALGK